MAKEKAKPIIPRKLTIIKKQAYLLAFSKGGVTKI